MTGETVGSAMLGDLERIAYHEAGHVAVRRNFERAIFLERGYVLIDSVGGYGQTGLNSGNLWGGRSDPPLIDHPSIVTAMAGRAAEAIRYHDSSHVESVALSAGSDEPLARCYIRILHGHNLSDDDIADKIREAEAEASRIVRGVWDGVKALAETLLTRLKTGRDDNAELTGAEALHVMDTALRLASTWGEPA
ncbi:MAG: hypothetical protein WA459_19955 [Stellaceae bacterium]